MTSCCVLSHTVPDGYRNPLKQSILISGGKENKRDSVSSGERKRKRSNRIRSGQPNGDVACGLVSCRVGEGESRWKAEPERVIVP